MSAKFIFFEGSDYVGKSTQINKLYMHLTSKKYRVAVIREPGSTPGMECIRKRLLDKEANTREPLDYLTRRLLYAADHAQGLSYMNSIKNKFDYILVDRYTLISDLVFGPLSLEGNNDDLYIAELTIHEDMAKIYDKFYNAKGGSPIHNAIIIIMPIKEETLVDRINKRNSQGYDNNILDEKSLEFKKTINRIYNKLADLIRYNVLQYSSYSIFFKGFAHKLVIDADSDEGNVFNEILTKLGIKGD